MRTYRSHIDHETCQRGAVATDQFKKPLSRGRHQLKDPGRWRKASPASCSSLQPVSKELLLREDGPVQLAMGGVTAQLREALGIKPMGVNCVCPSTNEATLHPNRFIATLYLPA